MTLVTGQWNDYTLEGVPGKLWWGGVFVPDSYDARTQAAAVFLSPPGGRAVLPAYDKGETGLTPIFSETVVIDDEIEWDDVTPVSESWVLIDPGDPDTDTPPTYQQHKVVRKAEPGAGVTSVFLDSEDLVGTPAAGYYPAYVTDTGTAVGDPATGDPGALWTAPKVGTGPYWPATIVSATNTAGPISLAQTTSIPAQPFPWRPRPVAQSIITGAASDVRVDLIARLNDATTGQIVGRGFGVAGTAPPRNDLIAGPPAGSASSYGRIEAGVSGTVVYLRAERQAGSASFSTDDDTTSFYVEIVPLLS